VFRYFWFFIGLLAVLCAIFSVKVSAALLEPIPETSAPADDYIQGAADPAEVEKAAPPPIIEETQNYNIPLGYSGDVIQIESMTDSETLASIDYSLKTLVFIAYLAIAALFIWFTILKPLLEFFYL